MGIIYPILVIAILVVTPAIAFPFILLIVLASYVHAFMVIAERNDQIQKAQLSNIAKAVPPVTLSSGMQPRILATTNEPESGQSFCKNCGHHLKPESNHCPHCGLKSSKEQTESAGNDKTRVYG